MNQATLLHPIQPTSQYGTKHSPTRAAYSPRRGQFVYGSGAAALTPAAN